MKIWWAISSWQSAQPRDVDTNKWCEYHCAVEHNTDDLYTLKREIEKLIRAGHLKRFVQRNERQQAPAREEKKETLVTRVRGAEVASL